MLDRHAIAVLRENARVCAPSSVTRHLGDIASASDLTVVVDLDALGEIERPLWLVLDALSHARTQIIIASRLAEPVTPSARWWRLGPVASPLTLVRERTPATRVIAISDDAEWTGAADGALSVERPIEMRAVLWWIVGRRSS